jgi:hypothetical protein
MSMSREIESRLRAGWQGMTSSLAPGAKVKVDVGDLAVLCNELSRLRELLLAAAGTTVDGQLFDHDDDYCGFCGFTEKIEHANKPDCPYGALSREVKRLKT